MAISARSPASRAPTAMLVDLARLEREYYAAQAGPGAIPTQLVSFGTSGHRGSPLARLVHRGPHPRHHAGDLRLPARARASTARSTWARTRTRCPSPAQRTALEVLAANGVETIIQRDDGVTPTPVISRAILAYNRGRTASVSPTASSSRRRTTRRRTAASSTTRPTAARPTPT